MSQIQQQQSPPGSVDLTTLSSPQLSQLQSRLSQELTHLTTSHQRLRAAQARFRDCIRSIQLGLVSSSSPASKENPKAILVPLTTSLYVPGVLARPDAVLVDVGTGFYVEKNTTEAVKFYEGKVAGLEGNLNEIGKMVQGKEGTLRVVEEVLRAKVLEEQQGQRGGGPQGEEGDG